jgi:quinol monooxygenase YgiN
MVTDAAQLVVVATAKALAGKEDDLERALRDVGGPTRAQPGCLQWDLFRSAQDPATMTAIEWWASAVDHERHLQGDHVKTLLTRFDGILAGPPDIVAMTPL